MKIPYLLDAFLTKPNQQLCNTVLQYHITVKLIFLFFEKGNSAFKQATLKQN